MHTLLRRSLFIMLALALLAGCGKKNTDDGLTPEPGDAPMTAEEQQAASTCGPTRRTFCARRLRL